MKFFPLVWAMLWRSKARTWLTFLSIVVAFVLFALLHTLERGFFQGVRLAGDDRLIVTHHQGVNSGILLASYLSRIESVAGVRAVQLLYFLGGYYQDPKNQVQVIAIDASKPRGTAGKSATAFRSSRRSAARTAARTGSSIWLGSCITMRNWPGQKFRQIFCWRATTL